MPHRTHVALGLVRAARRLCTPALLGSVIFHCNRALIVERHDLEQRLAPLEDHNLLALIGNLFGHLRKVLAQFRKRDGNHNCSSQHISSLLSIHVNVNVKVYKTHHNGAAPLWNLTAGPLCFV